MLYVLTLKMEVLQNMIGGVKLVVMLELHLIYLVNAHNHFLLFHHQLLLEYVENIDQVLVLNQCINYKY